jgi:hypothetical protein
MSDPYFVDSFWISWSRELSYILSSASFFASAAISARKSMIDRSPASETYGIRIQGFRVSGAGVFADRFLGQCRLLDGQIISGDGGAQDSLQLLALGFEKGMLDDEAAVVKRQGDPFGGQQLAKTQFSRLQGQRQRNRSALDQIFFHCGDDLAGAAHLEQGDIFNRLQSMHFENVPCDEIGKRAKARNPNRLPFEFADAGDRRGREKRGLSFLVLATHHDQIGPGNIGIDDGAGGRVDDIDVAAEKRLHGRCAGADKEKLHIGPVLPI